MKTRIFGLLLGTLLLAQPTFANTKRGASDGGGGSRVETLFRERAEQIFATITELPEIYKKCNVEQMKSMFNGMTNIRLVNQGEFRNDKDELIDEKFQNLDAWSYKFQILLVESTWNSLFKENTMDEESLDRLILHEVLRTIPSIPHFTGNCNDDDMRISSLYYNPKKYGDDLLIVRFAGIKEKESIPFENEKVYKYFELTQVKDQLDRSEYSWQSGNNIVLTIKDIASHDNESGEFNFEKSFRSRHSESSFYKNNLTTITSELALSQNQKNPISAYFQLQIVSREVSDANPMWVLFDTKSKTILKIGKHPDQLKKI